MQLHRVISSVSSFCLPFGHIFYTRLVDQAIEIVESNHSALALSKITTVGEGRGRGMAWYGDSWLFMLYHPSHQLKKTRDNGRIVQYILLFLTSLKNCTWVTEWYEYRIMLDLDYCRVPAQPNLAACSMLTPQQTLDACFAFMWFQIYFSW